MHEKACHSYHTLGIRLCLGDGETKNPVPTQEQIQEKQEEISISITPQNPIQGEPVLISINGTSTIESLVFSGKKLPVFINAGKPSALVGIDLRGRVGTYPVEVQLDNSEKIEKNLFIGQREIAKAPLGIPEKLGGNTPESEKELVNTLVQEGAIINAIETSDEKLWEGEFELPLKGEVVVTDTYGYSRITGASSISHKGTDFRAQVGTPVYAMNSGKVAFKRFLRNYGNTVAIDHGLGLLTIYMHLSEISVEVGQLVERGDLIGKSGDTGYVLGPHLHLTVRINNISIDPMKFIELFD